MKESVGEKGRVGVIIAGLQSIVPRYLALNLYRGSELKYTILGTVSRDEELVSFYFPKVRETLTIFSILRKKWHRRLNMRWNWLLEIDGFTIVRFIRN